MHEDENLLCPFVERKIEVHRLSALCEIRVPPDKEIYRLAKGFQLKARVSSKDALHLACAQSVRSRLFLTCDDEIIQRARRLNLDMTVINPVEYVREVGSI